MNEITEQYAITKSRCQSMIGGVCNQCGGELHPIETVDNSGNPTFWAGCSGCNIFCWGVSKEVYEIAKTLVEEKGYVHYDHMLNDRYRKENQTPEYQLYFKQSQISGATGLIQTILNIQQKIKQNERDHNH